MGAWRSTLRTPLSSPESASLSSARPGGGEATVSAAVQLPGTVVETFLRRAAARGERSLAGIRIGICLIGIANFLIVAQGWEPLLRGEPKQVIIVTVMSSGVLFSLGVRRRLRDHPATPFLLDLSVLQDALLTLVVMTCSVVWPVEHYSGMMGLPNQTMLSLALVGSGFRLSPRAVWVGAAVIWSWTVVLLVYDTTYQLVPSTTPDDFGVFGLLMVSAGLLGLGVATRTRSLVSEGAQAVVQAERARQRLGVYVSEAVAEEVMASEVLSRGGSRRRVAVLFSDLRGFTQYSEKLDPEQLVRELNAYLEAMGTVIREEGGVVDKYIGDAIMVVFGVPLARGDEAERAIRTAGRMQEALEAHNRDRAARGLAGLQQGVGVHWGEAVAGNIGTEDRLQYTVIGDVVNLASRLEGATKELKLPVLLSADVVQAARASGGAIPALHSAGRLSVRGREGALEVFGLSERDGVPSPPPTPMG